MGGGKPVWTCLTGGQPLCEAELLKNIGSWQTFSFLLACFILFCLETESGYTAVLGVLLLFVGFVLYVSVCKGGTRGVHTPAKCSAIQLYPALPFSKVPCCLRASPTCFPNMTACRKLDAHSLSYMMVHQCTPSSWEKDHESKAIVDYRINSRPPWVLGLKNRSVLNEFAWLCRVGGDTERNAFSLAVGKVVRFGSSNIYWALFSAVVYLGR